MVLSRELISVLPCLGKISLDLRTRLRQSIERDLPYCKLRVTFRSKCRLNTLFQFHDSFEEKICSVIIYHYICFTVTTGLLITRNSPSLLYTKSS